MNSYQKAKDIFTQRRTANGKFEESPLIALPNSAVVTNANNDLIMIPLLELIPSTASYSQTASYIEASNIHGTILNSVSSSYVPNIYPVNLDGYVLVESFNSYTSSNDERVSSLINSTSSYLTTSSIIGNSISASYIESNNIDGTVLSSSYSLTASYAFNGGSSIIPLETGSTYPITSSCAISASYAPTQFINTSSLVDDVTFNDYTSSNDSKVTSLITSTSSYLTTSSIINSASYSTTASYAPLVLPSNISTTASWSNNSVSSSAATSITFIPDLSNTASYVLNSVSSSYVPNLYPVNLDGYSLTSSFNNYTSSNNDIVNNLINVTGSFITNLQTSSMTVATSSYLIGYVPPILVSSSISSSYSLSSSASDSITFIPNLSNSASYVANLYPQTYQESGSWASASISSSYASIASAISFIPNLSDTASFVLNAISSSAANSITFIPDLCNTSSYVITAQTASYITSINVVGIITSSSYSLSSSYAPLVLPSNISTTASWSNNSITASSINFISNLSNTASYYSSSIINSQLPSQINISGITSSNGLYVSGGNVRIGTQTFQVGNSIFINDTSNWMGFGQTNPSWWQSSGCIWFHGSSYFDGNVILGGTTRMNWGSSKQWICTADGATGLAFATGNSNERMRITDSGSVGIMTTNPHNALDVVGNISCSVITASVYNPSFIQLPFTSSINTLAPSVYTGSMYVNVTSKLLYIYSGTSWMSSSMN